MDHIYPLWFQSLRVRQAKFYSIILTKEESWEEGAIEGRSEAEEA